MAQVILDFCGECGALQEEGLGLKRDPRCQNCDHNVTYKGDRIQGIFSEEDSRRLKNINFGE